MTTAVLVCPGRGTYNKPELGTLSGTFPDPELLRRFDGRRMSLGQETLTALDQAPHFSPTLHTRGDNASALIFAASYGDFLTIREEIEVVAITGNSMGWYSALACAGALSPLDAFHVVNTMGTLMQEALIGGQLIYPHMDEDWRPNPQRKRELLDIAAEIDGRAGQSLSLSIDLGGMLVLAGNEAGLSTFEQTVPAQDRFPMRLPNHAAFHTSLMSDVSSEGQSRLPPNTFRQPSLPLVDGRGGIWWPGATDIDALWAYTLGHQVTEAYDFTHAVGIAAREFAPDLFIVTGPGSTLGGAVAQSLILKSWRGMASKADFQDVQAQSPILVSMGRAEQRHLVTSA